MLTQVESDADGTKHFEVVDEQGWKAAYKHVFRKMLESEAEASRPELRVKTCLCSRTTSSTWWDWNLLRIVRRSSSTSSPVVMRSVCSQAVSGLMRTTMRS